MQKGIIVPRKTKDIIASLIEDGFSVPAIAQAVRRSIRAINDVYQGREPTQEEDGDLVCFYAYVKCLEKN
jgi:hypothetical protein